VLEQGGKAGSVAPSCSDTVWRATEAERGRPAGSLKVLLTVSGGGGVAAAVGGASSSQIVSSAGLWDSPAAMF